MDRQGIDMQVLIPVPFQAYYSIRNKRGHKSIEIIKFAQKNLKNSKLYFIIGSDNIINFHKWQ